MIDSKHYQEKTLFVTVKTYPNPSQKYIETTCVSGITDNGQWIRLHPVNFRSLDEERRFPRYSWIRVHVNKSTQDNRPESYHLDIDNIEHLRYVSTANKWQERRSLVEPLLSRSVEELKDKQEADGTSLGVIRPKEIRRFRIEKTTANWSQEELAKLDRQQLFAFRTVPLLEKIPYDFKYEFICDDPRCNGHTMKVLDWEVGQAYRNWSRGRSTVEWQEMFRKEFDYKVRHYYDSLFFLGTLAAHPKNWIIGGIFFAPQQRPQQTLWQVE
jgi:hypothetical protein